MTIENNGFLSSDINHFIESFNEKLKTTFSYCRNLNKFAQKLLYSLNIRNRMLNELIIGSAYTHLLSSFQGSILMAERGMSNEMRVLSRNFLEMVFLICAISNNEDNAKLFLLDDEIQRKKLLNKYSTISPEYQNKDILPKIQKVIADVKNNIKSKNIKHITIEYLSKEAKLFDHYKSYYAILSLSVHPSARELQFTFSFNDKNEIKSINYGPNEDDIEKILLSNCSCLLITIKHIKKEFSLPIDEKIKKFKKKFDEIWNSKFK